ncbi:hypothetical protein [Mycolicibacter kumamotonensis]|uniref:Uncharacterized protein n=1 Tax=Mycolicibacter kumamotonensis TaxID=354243 RepID=A0A1B8SBD3_9MYCO|nr:hypothetical protein [Mycolicibacter kumamotonensis]OBY30045.1 hypothetical protein ACT18_19915 [Mycolicibacter kumamotonensis]
MADKRLELAYDAAQKALAMQDATLGNFRTRANNLLATAALFTTFSTAVGLINTDEDKGPVLPAWGAFLLLLVLLFLAFFVLRVLWPEENWPYGPSAKEILARCDAGDDEDAVRKYVTDKMIEGLASNRTKLESRQNSFKLAALLLVVEVVLLVALLAF